MKSYLAQLNAGIAARIAEWPSGREMRFYPAIKQLTLDSSLTDRLATFDWDGTPGIGIFDFALTRSRSYSYRPTLAG